MNKKYNRSYGYARRPQLEEKQTTTTTTPSSLKLISICANGERSGSAPTPGNEEQNGSHTCHTSQSIGGSKKRPLTTGNNSLVLVSKFDSASSDVDGTSLSSSSSSHLYYKSVGSRPSRHRHSFPHYKDKKSSLVNYSKQPRRFPVRDKGVNKTWKRPVDETNDETLIESHHVKTLNNGNEQKAHFLKVPSDEKNNVKTSAEESDSCPTNDLSEKGLHQKAKLSSKSSGPVLKGPSTIMRGTSRFGKNVKELPGQGKYSSSSNHNIGKHNQNKPLQKKDQVAKRIKLQNEELTDYAYQRKACKGIREATFSLVRVNPKDTDPICKRFLRGECVNEHCKKRHDIPRYAGTPICSFFQRGGLCTRDNCPFLHIKVPSRSELCPNFTERGYCEDKNCMLKHYMVSSRVKEGNKLHT